MSLINQMLQDLDSRRAISGPKSGLPNDVRPLPVARRSSAPLFVGIGLLVIAAVGGVVWQLADLRDALGHRADATMPAPPDAAVLPGLPASPVAPLPTAEMPLAVSPQASSQSSAADELANLRLTTSLRLLPERESSAATSRTGPAPAPVSGPTAAPARPAATARADAALPMVIEKSTALGSQHERAESEYRKAMNVLNMGRLPEAIESLRTALKQDASHTASRQLLFKLLVENRRLDEAADLLQEGLLSQPAQISWAMSLGRLQVDRADLAGAWQTLQRSLPFASSSADYQGFAGHVLQRLGRSKEAVERYQAATRLAPAEGRWWLGLGLAFEADGHSAEARDALLRARATGTLNTELISLVDQKLR